MKNLVESLRRDVQRIGFLPFVLVSIAILLLLGATFAPWIRASAEVAMYNQAVDELPIAPSESLNILQFLWHEGHDPVVRQASAYNAGSLLGSSQDPQAEVVALQALSDAVRMNPDDEYAKRNLEILLRKVAAEQQGGNATSQGNSNAAPGNNNNGQNQQPSNGRGYNQAPSGF